MSIFRLLPFSLLIATAVSPLAAQSSPEQTPVAMQSADSRQQNASASPDLLLLFPDLKTEQSQPEPMDGIRIGEYHPRLSQFAPPRTLLMDPDWQAQDDGLCLKLRTYKVARDDPHSDSTHAAGYSTCTPAARFQMHTTEFRVPATPR
jgi:hypothetical protein